MSKLDMVLQLKGLPFPTSGKDIRRGSKRKNYIDIITTDSAVSLVIKDRHCQLAP